MELRINRVRINRARPVIILSMHIFFLVKFYTLLIVSTDCFHVNGGFPLPFKFQLCIIIKGGVKETNIVLSEKKKVEIRLNLLLFQLFLAITFISRQMHTV